MVVPKRSRWLSRRVGATATPPSAAQLVTKFCELEPRDMIAAYNGLRSFEGDFDKSQGTVRTVASTWMLATVGALGFLYVHRSDTDLKAAIATVIALVLLLGTLGLAALWFIDQRIYQRLLHSVFSLGCYLEISHDILPPIRSYMYIINRDVNTSFSTFYIIPIVLLLAGGALNLLYQWMQLPLGASVTFAENVLSLSFLSAVMFVVQGAVAAFMWQLSRGWSDLRSMIPNALDSMRKEDVLARLRA